MSKFFKLTVLFLFAASSVMAQKGSPQGTILDAIENVAGVMVAITGGIVLLACLWEGWKYFGGDSGALKRILTYVIVGAILMSIESVLGWLLGSPVF